MEDNRTPLQMYEQQKVLREQLSQQGLSRNARRVAKKLMAKQAKLRPKPKPHPIIAHIQQTFVDAGLISEEDLK